MQKVKMRARKKDWENMVFYVERAGFYVFLSILFVRFCNFAAVKDWKNL